MHLEVGTNVTFGRPTFADNVDDMESKSMKKAADLGIPVVELSILDAMKSTLNEEALSLIQMGNIAPWDCPDVFSDFKHIYSIH